MPQNIPHPPKRSSLVRVLADHNPSPLNPSAPNRGNKHPAPVSTALSPLPDKQSAVMVVKMMVVNMMVVKMMVVKMMVMLKDGDGVRW